MTRKSKVRRRRAGAAGKEGIRAPAAVAAASPRDGRDWRGWRGLELPGICAALALLVFGVFGQTASFGFVNFDDNVYVYENPIVSRGITIAGLRWSLFYGEIGHWHPLTWMVHMLDCQLFGQWAGGHHLTNVTLQGIAAVLLFLLLLQMTGRRWCSAFVAAAWAIHPLRAESVAWVSELKDVLSAVFFLLSAGAYVRYVRRPSGLRYLALVVLFALGLLSKNMLVTLPFVLLVLDYWPLGRLRQASDFWRLVREKLPLFILSIISCGITFMVPEKVGADERLPAWLRIENAIVSCCIYLRQTVWPTGLAPYYPNPTRAFPVLEVAGAIALTGLISAVAIGLRKQRPSLLAGWLWFIIMLGPVIGIVQIASYSHADRYTYLPQIGLLVAAVWAAADWAGQSRPRRITMGIIAAVILSALSVAAWRQTSNWRDSETLWARALASTEDNFFAHDSLGIALFDAGRTEEAIAHYRAAIEINPVWADARSNLGTALARAGHIEEAVAQCREAVQLNPDNAEAHNNLGGVLERAGDTAEAATEYREALRIKPGLAQAHTNLGEILVREGHVDEGIGEYEQALRINPGFAEPHNNLGAALSRRGQFAAAIDEYREALRLDPAYATAHSNLGLALYNLGRQDEGIAEYHAALRRDPANADAHYNLGNALLEQGRVGDATAEYEAALQTNPAYAEARLNLGVIYCGQGRLDDAISQFREALKIDPGNPDAHSDLGVALFDKGSVGEAIAEYEKAIALNPGDADAQGNLGAALLEQGRAGEAISHLGKALELRPGNPTAEDKLAWALATAPQPALRDGARAVQLASQATGGAGGANPAFLRTLAAAYAEAGRFPDALATAQKALQLAQAQSNAQLGVELRGDIALYKAGQPVRDARQPPAQAP